MVMSKKGLMAAVAALALLLAGAASALTMHTEVENPALEMTVKVGYDGLITYGKAFPVRITIRNNGEDFEGRLGLNAYISAKVYDRFEEYREAFPDRALFPFMLDASVPLQEAVKTRPEKWTLIFGNEGKGLPKEFATYGQAVRIESNEKVDSLNLGIAAGIGIYEFIMRNA